MNRNATPTPTVTRTHTPLAVLRRAGRTADRLAVIPGRRPVKPITFDSAL